MRFLLIFFVASFMTVQARAELPIVAGMNFSSLSATSVSGGLLYPASEQGTTVGFEPFFDTPIEPYISLGLGLPMTINTPGPTSNAGDVGIAPRVQLLLPNFGRIQPFIMLSPALSFSRLPTEVWWQGWMLREMAGASFAVSGSFRLVAGLGYTQTRFEGDSPTYVASNGNGPTMHGSVRSSYFTVATGFGVAF